MSIAKNSNGQKYIVAPECKISFQKPETLLHSINIFLELFGRCEILLENLDGYTIKNLKRLNWKVLPPGKWPWEKIEKEVKSLIEKVSEQKQIVIKYRLKTITEFSPEFVAIGQAGFSGYLICGFPEKNLYVLESLFLGNATYIFQENWEELSKLTKAEILNENLQKDRIIHRKHWRSHIHNLLK